MKQQAQQYTKTQKGDPQTPRQVPVTGPTWKMPKTVKALLTTFTDPHQRGHYKRMMIDAWHTQQKHAAENAKKRDKKSGSASNTGAAE
jgi:hypothetical protein